MNASGTPPATPLPGGANRPRARQETFLTRVAAQETAMAAQGAALRNRVDSSQFLGMAALAAHGSGDKRVYGRRSWIFVVPRTCAASAAISQERSGFVSHLDGLEDGGASRRSTAPAPPLRRHAPPSATNAKPRPRRARVRAGRRSTAEGKSGRPCSRRAAGLGLLVFACASGPAPLRAGCALQVSFVAPALLGGARVTGLVPRGGHGAKVEAQPPALTPARRLERPEPSSSQLIAYAALGERPASVLLAPGLVRTVKLRRAH